MAHSTEFVPLAVLLASVAGSFHCVSMCGGLMVAVTTNRLSIALYQLGRLLGYVAFGAAAGALGAKFFTPSAQGWLPWVASIILASLFFLIGARTWNGNSPHFQMPKRFMQVYIKIVSWGGFWTGLVSAFLPCGWLHSFILGAAATGSAVRGMAFMAVFWVGTVPALSMAPVVLRKIFRPFFLKAPKISAVLMISAGVVTLGYRVVPLIQSGGSTPSESSPHCHH